MLNGVKSIALPIDDEHSLNGQNEENKKAEIADLKKEVGKIEQRISIKPMVQSKANVAQSSMLKKPSKMSATQQVSSSLNPQQKQSSNLKPIDAKVADTKQNYVSVDSQKGSSQLKQPVTHRQQEAAKKQIPQTSNLKVGGTSIQKSESSVKMENKQSQKEEFDNVPLLSKQSEVKITIKSSEEKINKQTEDNDDFNDDLLDDSMELRESTIGLSVLKQPSGIKQIGDKQKGDLKSKQTPDKEGDKGSSNKIYQTTPSKLNTKFGVNSQQKQGVGIKEPGLQKQQNIKPSVIQSKKTIQNLQENSKPLVQLDTNLSMSNLTKIPPEQITNINLRSLDLRTNKLSELPPEFFNLENLWKLQLDQNQFSDLRDEFSKLKQLRVLTLNSNQLKSIPPSVFDCSGLERLEFASNQITDLPSTVSNLQKLKCLHIQDNLITSIPLCIATLKGLTQFGCEWFQYIRPNLEKILKKQEPSSSSQNEGSFEKVISLFNILYKQLSVEDQQNSNLTFLDFLILFYKSESAMDLFNSTFIIKKQTVIHLMCKYNHIHLFESLQRLKESVDINLFNENGESPLMIALSEKSTLMVDKILKEFQEELEFEDSIYHNLNRTEQEEGQTSVSTSQVVTRPQTSNLNNNQRKPVTCSHPLLIAVKKQMLEVALRIFSIIVKKQHKLNALSGGIMIQQLLDLNTRDELKNTLFHYLFMNFSANMEFTVELCQELLKYNERCQYMMHMFLQQAGQTFNINEIQFAKLNMINRLGQTPLDVAIELKQNPALEFAIYYNKNLLPAFNNGNIQILKPKFDINYNKSTRGLTPIHRAILVQNYKAIYLLLSTGECDLFVKDKEFKTARDYCQKVLFLAKYLRKGEANYLRANLFKNGAYSSKWSSHQNQKSKFEIIFNKQVNHNNLNLYQLSKRVNRVKYNSWYTRLEQRNMLSSSQQPTFEQRDEDQDEVIDVEMHETNGNDIYDDRHDIIDENDEEPLQFEVGLKNSINVLHSAIKEGNAPSFVSKSSKDEKKIGTQKQKGFQDKRDSITSGKKNGKETNSKKTSFIQQQQPTRNTQKQLEVGLKQQDHTHGRSQQSKKSQQAPLMMGVDDVNQSLTESRIDDYKNIEIDEEDLDSFNEDDELLNPAALLNQQNHYVMLANDSKLARKPYYKQLQKNKYEREYCYIMDDKQTQWERVKSLYQLYAIVQVDSASQSIGDFRDSRDIFKYLKFELENKEETLQPLKIEINYLLEKLQCDYESSTQTNAGMMKKNNGFYIDKNGQLPLPSIQEISCDKVGVSRSLVKKNSGSGQEAQNRNRVPSNYSQSSKGGPLMTTNPKQSQSKKDEVDNGVKLNTTNSQKNLELVQKQGQAKSSMISLDNKHISKGKGESRNVNNESLLNRDNKSENQQPTSPRATSNQVNQKSSVQSLVETRNSVSKSNQKSKESCIKKIEVVLKEQQDQTQNDQNAKWKNLTINPNAPVSARQSNIGMGANKGIQKQTLVQTSQNSKISTPSSQKGTPSNLGIGSQSQIGGISSKFNNKTNGVGSSSVVANLNNKQNQATAQGSQQQLSTNRSNSNPRNGLLNVNSNLKKQATSSMQKKLEPVDKTSQSSISGSIISQQTQNVSEQKESIVSSQSIEVQSSSSNNQPAIANNKSSGISKIGGGTMQSKLKGPTRISAKPSTLNKM